MLTDDDLTRELRARFDHATDGLIYTGITPTARRTPSPAWLALPAVAASAVVAVTATTGSPTAQLRLPSPTSATAHTGPASSLPTVTADFEVAGYTVRYRGAGPAPADDLRWETGVSRPVDAQRVDAGELGDVADGVQAWVGTDPDSGDNALYLTSPVRDGGREFAVMSESWSLQQLQGLVFTDGPH